MRRGHAWSSALGGVLLATTVACSASASSAAGEAREAARTLFGAVQRGDGAAACAALLPEAARGLATDDSPCAREILTMGLTGGPIRDVEVWGGRARLRAGDDVVFLADFGDGWRVAAAGCERLPGQDRYDCEVEA